MTLYRGDDTDAFGGKFITILKPSGTEATITKAVFLCGSIKKTFEAPIFPLEVELTSEETSSLSQFNNCYLAVWDEDDKKRTCEGTLTFNTKNEVINE